MKYVWKKNEKAVSPVIATILMVAITVVLAAVLVVYMRNYGKDPGTTGTDPIEKVISKDNKNWNIKITKVDKIYEMNMTDIVVNTDNNILLYKQNASIASNWTGNRVVVRGVSGSSQWFAVGAVAPTDSGGTAITGAYQMVQNIATVKKCQFVFIDNNYDYKISAGDVFYVYGDNNGDGSIDVQVGYKFQILEADKLLCEAVLG